jgi:predicted TIM-barrel fold metal-dependent hydrolase
LGRQEVWDDKIEEWSFHMALVIDGFSHFLPKTFAEELGETYPTGELKGLTGLAYFSDLENRARVLDKFKIDRQVLTLARPNIWINMPKDIALKMTRAANDALAKGTKQFPDRFIAVGTLPMLNEEFSFEFDRCVEELGMAGIQIFTNIEGKSPDDPESRWLFLKANRMRIPLWIHPQVRNEWPQDFALDKILGWPFETSLVMSRLVFSGIMEEYPHLKIITHHMGGMIPYFSERIKGGYEGRELFSNAKFGSLPKDPLDYFRRFYGDTVLNGSVPAFECGYKFFGPEHILFATDYPFGPKRGERWIEGALHQIMTINLPQTEKDQILGGNLQRMMGRC